MIFVSDCQPVQIWMTSRHGARYPKVESVNKLSTLPKLREQIVHNHEHRGSRFFSPTIFILSLCPTTI